MECAVQGPLWAQIVLICLLASWAWALLHARLHIAVYTGVGTVILQVLLFESHYREFFYRALRPLRHMISAPEGTR